MNSSIPPTTESSDALPIKAIVPGLVAVVVMDILAVAGVWSYDSKWSMVAAVILFVTPWVTLIVLRQPPGVLAYHRHRAGLSYAWGMLAGAIWRGLSMFFNYRVIYAGSAPFTGVGLLFSALIWVPLIEETFFRGYLGKALNANLGPVWGIFLQAILFTFQPVHWLQSWPALVSVFVFGILAGWLVERLDSIWVGWGAHGLANVLPGLLWLFA